MNTVHSLQLILVIAGVTFLTRALPFILFPADKPLPKILIYIGNVLQGAVMGMLVVYCFRNVTIAAWPFAMPELIASAFVIGMYLWRKNILLSVGLGTVFYMLLVQVIFPV